MGNEININVTGNGGDITISPSSGSFDVVVEDDAIEIQVIDGGENIISVKEPDIVNIDIGYVDGDNMNINKEEVSVEVLSSVAGAKADSMYQIAVRNGYEGTEAEFITEFMTKCVKRLTYSEFNAITNKRQDTIYAVTTDVGDDLRYIYLGNVLIAKKEDGGGSQGFPYSFPIVFGR